MQFYIKLIVTYHIARELSRVTFRAHLLLGFKFRAPGHMLVLVSAVVRTIQPLVVENIKVFIHVTVGVGPRVADAVSSTAQYTGACWDPEDCPVAPTRKNAPFCPSKAC